jgi:GT2 family glycosyltransferase
VVDVGDSAELGHQPALEQRRTGSQRASAIVVAGMHRTGTSAVTRVLALLGIDLPRHLVPGLPNNNDLGFWESVPIAQAHDRFLASIGSAWDDVSPLPPSVFASVKADTFIGELDALLDSEYGDSSLFVVKDPRLCRLMPLWIAALKRFGARPSFVITTRNPLEVAGSLKARDGFSATKSCLLWLRHLLDAERDSRGFARAFVSYEHLLRDWVSTSERIARELHLFWPRASHETHVQIEAFLSSALRHHSYDYSELRARSDVTEWVKQAFAAVSRAATDAELDTALFDEIRGQLDRADQAYGPLLAQARAQISEREAARGKVESQLASVAGELVEREDELKSLKTDNQLVAARLVEEIEAVALLHRVVDALVEALEDLGRGLGDAGAALISADGGQVTLHTALEQFLGKLRQRAPVEGEPEPVRQAIEIAITRTEEFLGVLDDDRARLLAALAERNAREVAKSEEHQSLEVEAQRIAEALATREAELGDALHRAEEAEVDAATGAGALRTAIEERDQWKEEAVRLSDAVSEHEESIAHLTGEYETLHTEAQRLAVAVADTETEFADTRRRLDSASADVGEARESLAERERTLADTLARLQAVESEASARERRLEGLLAERERVVSEAHARLDAAEDRLRTVAAELDQARFERESWLVESERLSDELNVRDVKLVDLRRQFDAREAELENARHQLEVLTTQLELAVAEQETLRDEGELLQTTLSDQREAIALAQAENAELERVVREHEQGFARTREEGRRLALALAEDEEALSRRSAELRERDEQLDGLSTELRFRDETLAQQSELLASLDAIGRARGRRWRSFTQFCSWLFPPTAEGLGYVKAYLRLRRSDQFDADYYLTRYPDVTHAGLNPLMHYVEHGRREGRQPVGTSLELSFLNTSRPNAAESLTLAPPVAPELAPPKPESPPEDVAPEGADVAAKLRRALAEHVPETATIAVATEGDEHLLSLPEYTMHHFPRGLDGTYLGNDARGDTSLIANLEAIRAAGTEFLFVPASHRSLLERNPRFRSHLVGHYSRLLDSKEVGACFALYSPDTSKGWRRQLADLAEWIERDASREASILDWNSGLPLGEELPRCNVFPVGDPELPHLDGSVDVVAVGTTSEARLAEAARVARLGVLEVPDDGTSPRLDASAAFFELAPTVSIVIPCHEQFAHTQACINALEETIPTWFRGEILIVDDASTPDTLANLQQLAESNPHVTLLRNEANSGFLASVNRAVEEASGEFTVLLNNDTIPLPGWLPPLLAPFRTRDDVGAVGGRLVYPDGRLQEAGGLVFRDGSAAKFGYGDPDPDFPLFTVPREVDYCSGCLLVFRRDFFLESGGFDPAYGFGFYEDADFCFRVRSLGLVVLYEPESVIVHMEGASAGTDLRQGAKRHQVLNASVFSERWRDALAWQHERPAELDRDALQHLARRTERR